MGVGGQPHAPAASTPKKDPIPILQESGWAPGLVWTGGKSRPHRDSIPDRPARSQSLYRLSYPAHCKITCYLQSADFNECITHNICYVILFYPLARISSHPWRKNFWRFELFLVLSRGCNLWALWWSVKHIHIFVRGKNRRMKNLPTAVAIWDQKNMIVWRWVNISSKPF